MRRVPLEHTRDVIRSAFWPQPSVCVAAAIALGNGLVSIDHAVPRRTLFLFLGPPAWRAVSAFLDHPGDDHLPGLVFSITIVVFQPTSGQS